MVGPSYLKTLQSLHSPSTLSSMKIKTLTKTLIFSHLCRILKALLKAKAILIETLKESQPIKHFTKYSTKSLKIKDKKRKIFFGSFRLHYNWCSSHVVPVQVMDGFSGSHFYYDSTWNSIIHEHCDQDGSESQLSGYLHWLEEKVGDNCTNQENISGEVNEIDKLADLFIANCHEKFRLEKQESYRMFQEMLARSM